MAMLSLAFMDSSSANVASHDCLLSRPSTQSILFRAHQKHTRVVRHSAGLAPALTYVAGYIRISVLVVDPWGTAPQS
jgi:hypothetical protein